MPQTLFIYLLPFLLFLRLFSAVYATSLCCFLLYTFIAATNKYQLHTILWSTDYIATFHVELAVVVAVGSHENNIKALGIPSSASKTQHKRQKPKRMRIIKKRTKQPTAKVTESSGGASGSQRVFVRTHTNTDERTRTQSARSLIMSFSFFFFVFSTKDTHFSANNKHTRRVYVTLCCCYTMFSTIKVRKALATVRTFHLTFAWRILQISTRQLLIYLGRKVFALQTGSSSFKHVACNYQSNWQVANVVVDFVRQAANLLSSRLLVVYLFLVPVLFIFPAIMFMPFAAAVFSGSICVASNRIFIYVVLILFIATTNGSNCGVYACLSVLSAGVRGLWLLETQFLKLRNKLLH